MSLNETCFNPCFNGFTILTYLYLGSIETIRHGFNPCFNGFTILTLTKTEYSLFLCSVSILVLMDSLFLLMENMRKEKVVSRGFNPCFNGFTILTITQELRYSR